MLRLRWVLVGLLALPGAASAAGNAEELAAAANQQYEAGNFLKAVELYREAYGISRATAILYNIAVVYDRKLNDRELAMDFYRQYLAAPDADPKAASRATTRLQELKAEAAQAEADARAAEEKRRQEEAARAAAAQKGAGGVDAQAPADESSAMRVGGWVAASAGVVMLGAGVYFGVSAGADSDDFGKSTSLADKQQLRDDGENKALIADVLYGAGGAALVAGVVLLLLAPDGEAPAVGAGPTPDGAGASLWFGGSL